MSVFSLPAVSVQITASIKPLTSIVAALLAPEDSVQTLLPVGVSPHDYALKLSDMQKLHSSDLVLWTGPDLERFLAKPLSALPADKVIAAQSLAKIVWPHLDSETLDLNEEHLDDDHHGEDDHDHHHGQHDPHLWLNPDNALRIAERVSLQLIALTPASEAIYKERLQSFRQQLQSLSSDIAAQLAPYEAQGFVVSHRGFDHFVGRFGMQQLAYINLTPEQRPGARHLYQLRQELQGRAQCVFVEPYGDPGAAQSLAKDLGLRIGSLDALGRDSASYAGLMTTLATAMAQCLSGKE